MTSSQPFKPNPFRSTTQQNPGLLKKPSCSKLLSWMPCFSMLLLSFISLVDRSILSILSPVLLRDLHLTAGQYGTAILTFSICYMVANPIWGLLMDRMGLFSAVILAVVTWSLASGTHAFLAGFLGLCVARGVLGFGEGATFPAGLKTVTETLPPERRSFGLALAYSGGSMGALLTPIVIVPIAARWGWRSTFVLSTVVGFGWIAVWLMLRALRLYQPYAGTAAAADSIPPSPRTASSSQSSSRWNRALFATSAVYGLGAAPIAFGLYATPLYLNRVLHQPQSALGHLLWIPPAGWETGYLLWGWVSDARRKRAAATTGLLPSPLGVFCLFAVASLLLAVIPMCASLPHALFLTMTLLFLIMSLSGGFVVLSLAHGATTQSSENTGFLAGFSISGWSLTTGVLMWAVGHMMDQGWMAQTFWLTAVLPCFGVILWKLLMPSERSGSAEVAG